MAKKKRFEPFLSVHFDAPSLFFALWSYRLVQVLSGSKGFQRITFQVILKSVLV